MTLEEKIDHNMSIEILNSKPIDENDMAYEFFGLDKQPEVVAEEPEPEVVAEVVPEPEPEPTPTPEPVVETVVPEYKAKKYVPIEDEEKLAELLDKKYGYKKIEPEEKALAFIKQQNPELDDNEVLFIAANDYGIGVDKPSEEDLTDAQVLELKKQDIARKKLFGQAEGYFAEQAAGVQLEGEDPLDLDPAYKAYQTETQKQAEARKEQQALYEQTITNITSASKKISDLKIPVEIDIDDSKLAIDVSFKLDDKKQKELINYAERYSPSKEEVAQYTDQSTGKFDFDGYMTSLARVVFSQDIIKAGIRQALAQDRQQFIEKELKNSTLRNNDVSQQAEQKSDFVDTYWGKYAGT